MNVNSQTDDLVCGTIEDDIPDIEGVYSYSTDPTLVANSDPLVLNVFFWGINRDDGTSENKLTEADALKAVALLNIKYNQFNIYLKYKGYDFIDSTRFYTIYADPDHIGNTEDSDIQKFKEFVSTHPDSEYYEPAINIYISKNTIGFSGAWIHWNRVVINATTFESDTGRTLNHEMGHNFSLKHTHKRWYYESEYCEHVTRDENDTDDPDDPDDTYFNANTNGDKVKDTAAVPDFKNELCAELGFEQPYYVGCDAVDYHYITNAAGGCVYENFLGVDCQGTLYEIEEKDVRNLMAYTYSDCGLDLTTGQGIRAREYVGNLNNNHFPYARADFEELYEPYKGEYYVVGPQPIEHPPLFQPGFEYRFIECSCDCPTPSDWSESFTYDTNTVLSTIHKDETNYSTITHPNHSAIWIKPEINSNQMFPPRKCYDNWNRKPDGGSITKFNDNVFNTNVSITPQDSTAINNQYLIQNLDSGLYKIEKNFEDGSTQETIIFKENN